MYQTAAGLKVAFLLQLCSLSFQISPLLRTSGRLKLSSGLHRFHWMQTERLLELGLKCFKCFIWLNLPKTSVTLIIVKLSMLKGTCEMFFFFFFQFKLDFCILIKFVLVNKFPFFWHFFNGIPCYSSLDMGLICRVGCWQPFQWC